ncbi:MAG: Rrf2 family transcriptional regulator [Sulfurospirillum sp.]|nr:Rrf2 family transcriptional regulator [Sulfurospirillum sp.]MBL0703131.1 Rrf2 family transcriptional regulator [Sulfurospirillum sp.]
MLLTKASEYALLSLIMISQRNTPQDVDTLSTELGISKSFLAKILQSLAKEGILKSYKGAHGGFLLAKEPSEFSLKQIIACAEKKTIKVLECTTVQGYCPKNEEDFCKILPFLNKLQAKIDNVLDNMSLKDIIS